ncbi:site-specific integrase [Desulfovibrio porci]|uniref:tyrosine-type recombinase/integrase n=1 Tax=Desulfovibrio porci TaxID=2605782 RepID=UPI002A827298|nr:site-specific integrase [Desulfovibrio porci]MDY3811009.1 site-specific integrase [Desulfovibrio porci]
MATSQKRYPTSYPGVFYRLVRRVGGKGEERAFYAVYKQNGKVVEAKVGYEFRDAMTAARAARIRADLIEGKRLTRAEKRREEARNLTLSALWKRYSLEQLTNPRTRNTDGSNFRHLPPELAAKRPAELANADLDRLKKELYGRGLSDQTVRHVLSLIRRLIRWGAKNALSAPPAGLFFELPQVDNQKTECLTEEQLQALIKALDEDPDQEAAAIMRLALYTGIRRSALLALEWRDVDMERGMLTLRGESAKSGHTSIIPLSEAARKVLKDLQGNPYRPESELIFPSGRTGGKRSGLPRDFIRRIREAAQLPPDFRLLHGLRHNFASQLASSGRVDMYTLQKLLTHESPEMTQRYAHLMDEALHRAAGVVDEIFPNTGKGLDR